jgi:hypothetical protein
MDGYGVLYGKLGGCTNAVAGLKECIEAKQVTNVSFSGSFC